MARPILLLAAAVTDRTFERVTVDGRVAWAGKCIHCNSKLLVGEDGRSLGEATLEHIVPRTRGGTDEVANLAVACARCNREKGIRHDHKRGERLEHVVATLQARRRERWREPEEVGMAARLAKLIAPADAEGDEQDE